MFGWGALSSSEILRCISVKRFATQLLSEELPLSLPATVTTILLGRSAKGADPTTPTPLSQVIAALTLDLEGEGDIYNQSPGFATLITWDLNELLGFIH